MQPKVIEDFDRMYLENCDNKKMNIKQRGISISNPFNPANKPPSEHLIPEKILEKPNRISNYNEMKDDKPLAGRFS